MAKAEQKNKFGKKIGEGNADIICNNGICNISSDVEILGIELKFKGLAQITPTLPDGWILQGNKNKMLILSLNGTAMQNINLFTYKGKVKLTGATVANKEGKEIVSVIRKQEQRWEDQTWDGFDSTSQNWDAFTNNKIKGKVRVTSYNLPDYNLPKIKLSKKNEKRKKTAQTRNRTGGY